MINLRQSSNFFKMRQAAAVHNRHPQVVDKLLLDENMSVPNGVEDLADRERRSGVLAYDAKAFLQFRGDCIFQPEKMIRLQTFSQARRFDRSQAVVNIVKQVKVVPKLQPQGFEQLRNM